MDRELEALSLQAGATLRARGWRLATAESCTGGWVAEVITATAGSSEWFDRGFVTYSNASKQEMLGVPADILATHGAVSLETTGAMAQGALARSHAQAALAISGIAGPSGGSPQKPVGTVCFAWQLPAGACRAVLRHLPGDREAVRRASVVFALTELIRLLKCER